MKNPPRSWLCGFFTSFCALLLPSLAAGAILPRHGVFDGVYHQDRWGVGHFGDFYVAPKLHSQLKEHDGKRITLEVKRAIQPMNPGPGMIERIGKITPLPDVPLQFDVSIHPIKSDLHTHELVCYLINGSQSSIDMSLQDLVLKISYPRETTDGDKPSLFFPVYTRQQMSVQHGLTGQWLNNSLVAIPGAFDSGHHLQIEPGQRFPVVTRLWLPKGQVEIHVRAHLRQSSQGVESWFQADASDTPADEDKLEGQQRLPLRITQARIGLADDDWQRLRISINAANHSQENIVLCNRGRVPLIAGVLSAIDAEGKEVTLHVKPCYNCSNLGQPWQLVPVPQDGIATELFFQRCPSKRFQLKILADDGLETFSFEAIAEE